MLPSSYILGVRDFRIKKKTIPIRPTTEAATPIPIPIPAFAPELNSVEAGGMLDETPVDDVESLVPVVLGSVDCVVGVDAVGDKVLDESLAVSTSEPTLKVELKALSARALKVSVVGLPQFTFTPSDVTPQQDQEFDVTL